MKCSVWIVSVVMVGALASCVQPTHSSSKTTTSASAHWTTLTALGQKVWQRVSLSDDGTKAVVASNNEALQYSSDGGATWSSLVSGMGVWKGLALSADGTQVVGVLQGGQVVKNSDLSKTIWNVTTVATEDSETVSVNQLAASSDLSILAVATSTDVRISTDGGSTWTSVDPGILSGDTSKAQGWKTVAVSKSSGAIAAAPATGSVYLSSDQGTTWSKISLLAGTSWLGAATTGHQFLFVGANWGTTALDGTTGTLGSSTLLALGSDWYSVAGSNDGTTLLAGGLDTFAGPALSLDSGATWTTASTITGVNWISVALSSEGTVGLAADSGSEDGEGGYLYLYQQ